MRISDWSSDVCSSDLRTGNLVYALFPHDTSRATDPQSHIHAVIANLSRLPEQFRNPDRVDEKTGEVIRDDGRSEEHTSELQSLMRISYAVFCLKKKNKKKNQTYHKIT